MPRSRRSRRRTGGATILLQLGYEHETPELAAKLGEAVSGFLSDVPDARVIALCNSGKEVDSLCAAAWGAARLVPLGGAAGLAAKGVAACAAATALAAVLMRRDVADALFAVRSRRR